MYVKVYKLGRCKDYFIVYSIIFMIPYYQIMTRTWVSLRLSPLCTTPSTPSRTNPRRKFSGAKPKNFRGETKKSWEKILKPKKTWRKFENLKIEWGWPTPWASGRSAPALRPLLHDHGHREPQNHSFTGDALKATLKPATI